MSANEEDGIAVIFDDVAAIVEAQRERSSGAGQAGQEDAEGVISFGAQLLLGDALVLEEDKIFAGGRGDGIDLEHARKLNKEDAFAGNGGVEIDGGIAFEGIVHMNRGVDLVMDGVKQNRGRSKTGKRVRGPDIVVTDFVDDVGLAKHEIFVAHVIHEHVERAGENAVDACVEEMARRRGIFLKQDTQGVCGIQAFELGKPERSERGVRGGLNGGLGELGKEILGSVVGEAGVNGDKLFIENGRTEEAGHLLFFDLVSREGQGVADPGKDKTGYAAVEGLKEHEFSALEGEDQIAMTELDAVSGGDGVNVIGIEAQRVERSEDVTRRIRGI